MVRVTGNAIRRIILEQSMRAGVGHIGSALSIADLIAAVYSGPLRAEDLDAPERDRFVLGKGHAALALYAALYLRGWISFDDLNSYCADDSICGVHPEHVLPGVDFCTGSLGQGLPIAVGSALAARLRDSDRHVFALISDAELNAGAVWEALMFAGHHKLSQLTVLLDENGQQAFGYTKEIINLPKIADQVRGFGWNVSELHGHDETKLIERLQSSRRANNGPQLIICHTVFGKGVSYMERSIKWHYWPMSAEEYKLALEEVAGGR